MQTRNQGKTQLIAAARAGISERSGREIDHDHRQVPGLRERSWRTRQDPLADVWDSELKPLLEKNPALQAMTLLEYLQSKDAQTYPDSILRTLQRRVKTWRALHGPEQEIMFRQIHPPGHQGLSDFTLLKGTTITIAGQVFKHLLYHFRLAFSHWSYMKVIEGGESYTALASGLQEALQRLGGAPKEHRTDSLSAAYKNLHKAAQDDVTARYESLCKNYSMKATRNNPGAGHENGSVESAHNHLKRRIEQALLLRGSSEFESIEDYQAFIDHVVQQHNQRNAKAIKIERQKLQGLPTYKAADYTEVSVVVSNSSTIDIRRGTYTVPSRLKSETLRVRLYDNRLMCYLGHQHVITLRRVYPQDGQSRAHQVDYRHVIHSLVKKPQALRHWRLRDALFPSSAYAAIWRHVDSQMEPKQACKFMVGLIHLAATQDCEQALGQRVLELIEADKPLLLYQLQTAFKKSTSPLPPAVRIEQHHLAQYDRLIPVHQEVAHA